MRDKNNIFFLWHVAFWAIYIFIKVYHEYLWTYPKYDYMGAYAVVRMALISQLGTLIPKMLFTYWVAYWVLPTNRGTITKIFFFLGGLGASAALYRLFVFLVVQSQLLGDLASNGNLFTLPRLSSTMMDLLWVAGIGTALVLLQKQALAKNREKELEKQKLSVELKVLKQQTNPHFLLNTLNNLYALSRKKSEKTPEVILKLSELLKFMLYGIPETYIPLSKEVELIRNYIDLEKLRFGPQLKIETEISKNLEGISIAPLLLLPLVENAFKHGASENIGTKEIKLILRLTGGDHLFFSVVNSLDFNRTMNKKGIGLHNLKRQLELQYKVFSLEVVPSSESFSVELALDLGEKNQVSYHRG
ncbi:sensor histidine kinase [Flagellimonas meridianipacifica]|uniref:Histidine kinase n=1 Tax=Flagellimonas meridianipacifica TaxID=1080225 RepID=A0A2T0MI69_9FLAO|nr:histidine kinase [Allomuricauda pacifica]PRX57287.1 histidine kinase [Allomuricauda pacifica]